MAEEKDLTAYCGLYCGDCYQYKGKIADLARDLRKELRQGKFDERAEQMSVNSFFAAFVSASSDPPWRNLPWLAITSRATAAV